MVSATDGEGDMLQRCTADRNRIRLLLFLTNSGFTLCSINFLKFYALRNIAVTRFSLRFVIKTCSCTYRAKILYSFSSSVQKRDRKNEFNYTLSST